MLTLQKIHHRGKDRLGIFFDFDPDIIALIKSLGNRKYSNTLKCWYLPYDHEHLAEVVNLNIDVNLNKLEGPILLPMHPTIKDDESLLSYWQNKKQIDKV